MKAEYPMYTELRAEKILETAKRLQCRALERFPQSGLGMVAGELAAVARKTQHQAGQISMPIMPLRIPIDGLLMLIATGLLSVNSKMAAIYIQEFPNAQTIRAVGEIENLATGLSRKIWQKITILDISPADTPHAILKTNL